MRYLIPLLFSSAALAHSGHGKPGLFHFHEFSDGLLMGIALAAVVLVVWVWKR